MPRRRELRLVLAAAVAFGLFAEWTTYGIGDVRHVLPDLLTGCAFATCGVIAWDRRAHSWTGVLLALTGVAWFAGSFATALAYLHRGPLIHALLAYPSGRVRGLALRVAIAIGYGLSVVTAVWTNEAATLALSGALVALAVNGYRGAVGAERRARIASLHCTVAFAVALAAGAAARLAFPAGDADDAVLLVYQLVLAGVAIRLAAPLISKRTQPPALTDLVVELGESRSGTLRDALATALGDPSLEAGFWIPEAGGYLDASGAELPLPEPGSGRSVTLVERDGTPVAALVHDSAVLGDPLVAAAVAAATRLAASNATLQAELRAQVVELNASRRRLLAAADDERRRLEQRLHDGVEQRLGVLAEKLENAHGAARDGTRERVAHAQDVLARTRRDLRALAHGLHPVSLDDEGLAGALAELAGASAVPVELSVGQARVNRSVEEVAYFVCAEALANVAKHARAKHATVVVGSHDSRLAIEVADDGVGGADLMLGTGLRGLADRLDASGGWLRIESPSGGGTRLVAELPLNGGPR